MTLTQTLTQTPAPTPIRRCIAALLFLFFALPTASAKLIDAERAQILLLPILQPAKLAANAAPDERVLRAGDLISIFLPDGAELKFLDANGPSKDVVVALGEARYRELSVQGGGHVPDPGIPPVRGHAWKRFGAAKAGVVHLQIRKGGEIKWFRFEVGAAPEFKYGSTVRRGEQDQGEPVSLTEFDQLVLELPGEVGDGWTTNGEAASGLKLTSLAQAAEHRVSLSFTVIRKEGAPYEQTLVVSGPAKQFNYIWHRAGVVLAR